MSQCVQLLMNRAQFAKLQGALMKYVPTIKLQIICDALDSFMENRYRVGHEKLKFERTANRNIPSLSCLSYLSVDLFVVVVVLVDLEVDLGRRDGDLPGHGHARRHQHRRRADVYRACSSGGMKKNSSLKEDRRLAGIFC